VGYNSVAEIRVNLHSFSRWRHQNLSAKLREIQSYCSSRSSKVIDLDANRKRTYMYVVQFSRYWRINLENSLFSPAHPCLTPPLKWNPSEFLAETFPAKTIGLFCGENCMILNSTVFNWFTHVTDGLAYRPSALCIMLARAEPLTPN